jgi:hypothetical protein
MVGWGSVTALSAMADDNLAGQIRYWFEPTLATQTVALLILLPEAFRGTDGCTELGTEKYLEKNFST